MVHARERQDTFTPPAAPTLNETGTAIGYETVLVAAASERLRARLNVRVSFLSEQGATSNLPNDKAPWQQHRRLLLATLATRRCCMPAADI